MVTRPSSSAIWRRRVSSDDSGLNCCLQLQGIVVGNVGSYLPSDRIFHIPQDCSLDTRRHATFISHTPQNALQKNVWKNSVKWTSTLKVILRAWDTQTTRPDVAEIVTLCCLCDANVSLRHSVSIFRVNIKLYHADGSSMEMDVSGCAMWFCSTFIVVISIFMNIEMLVKGVQK